MPEQRFMKETRKLVAIAVTTAAVALTIALITSIVSLVVAHREAKHASQIATQAQILAKTNAALLAQTLRIGKARRQVITQIARKNCSANHVLYTVLTTVENKALAQTEQLRASGAYDTLSPKLRASVDTSIQIAKDFIVQLKQVDCTSVPSIEHPKVRKPAAS